MKNEDNIDYIQKLLRMQRYNLQLFPGISGYDD